MRFFALTLAVFALFLTSARAETFPVIDNPTVLKECGECHMAFPPQTLTRAVWTQMINGLSDHFGEDASLDPKVAAEVLNYHLANASDVSDTRAAMKWTSDTPFIRLTEGPRFKEKHGGCSQSVWDDPKVKSKANCLACHATMQKDGSTEADIRFLPNDAQSQCNGLGAFGAFMDRMFQ
ncbi:MAG: hypothetical protein A2516_11360 [Alphaproteobacteria bacterium RIFOXYD12_FULL_60_8]|nr:MAG: hypothetical protein A2516_11360 [Alphaproteobacteria bacterium RIFOXYD12_FULL_60_8]